MGFSRQEYWSGLSRPPPGDLPDPGMIESRSFISPALAGGFFTTSATNVFPAPILPINSNIGYLSFSILHLEGPSDHPTVLQQMTLFQVF